MEVFITMGTGLRPVSLSLVPSAQLSCALLPNCLSLCVQFSFPAVGYGCTPQSCVSSFQFDESCTTRNNRETHETVCKSERFMGPGPLLASTLI